jgi:hypothetical protein
MGYRPDGAGRVGDVISGGGHGYLIRTGNYYAVGTEPGGLPVLTERWADASWWRNDTKARQWADRHLLPRRRPVEVTRVQFPTSHGGRQT